MENLTPSQLKAKRIVESRGGTFVSPDEYKRDKAVNSKGKVSKTAPAYNSYRNRYPSLSKTIDPEINQLIDQMLNPSDIETAHRFPNIYGKTAIFKSRTVIDLPISGASACAVVVHPKLKNSIFYTAGNSQDIQLPESADNLPKVRSAGYYTASENSLVQFGEYFQFPNGNVMFPAPHTSTGTARLLYQASITSPGTTGIVYTFQFQKQAALDQMFAVVRLYDSSVNVIHEAQQQVNSDGTATITITQAQYTGAGFFSIDFDFESRYDGPVSCAITAAAGLGDPVNLEIPNGTYHMRKTNLSGTDQIVDSAESYNVISQSMLITSNQSDLSNQGVIATARIPARTIIGDNVDSGNFDDWYSYISSLSKNTYNGPAKDGCYTFYLGGDPVSYYLRDVNDGRNIPLPYMVAEMRGVVDSDRSFRLQVDSIVQFTSNSTVYNYASTPMYLDRDLLMAILSDINSSYCNPLHHAEIKKGLKRIAKKASQILTNPSTYTNIAKVMAAITPLLV